LSNENIGDAKGRIIVRVLVTGATGFIGTYVVQQLLNREHEVIAVARDEKKAATLSWYPRVKFVACDIHSNSAELTAEHLGCPDALVHLAWPGLPNYEALFHYEDTLIADYRFVKSLVEQGLKQVLVTGTCLEYGMQQGCLSEDQPTLPTNPYALAKDALRKFLQSLQKQTPFTLQWFRLFYMHGGGQNPNSLLAQLDSAIDRGDEVFNMSGGEQVRDFLPVEEVARRIVRLSERVDLDGIYNCCSGTPISVRTFVEKRIHERNAKIELNLGHYPYPDYEPMEFWGDTTKYTEEIERD
jgi:nucleoside-diphosphate-sugar epimerase